MSDLLPLPLHDPRRPSARVVLALALALAFALNPAASAQDSARVAVVQASAGSDEQADLRTALVRRVRTRLEALGLGRSAGTPGVALADLGLAVGCVGETDACLAAVARQLDVDALLVLSLDVVGSSLTLTLTRFDVEGGSSQRVQREATNGAALVDEVDSGLRELFDLPAAEVGQAPDGSQNPGPPPQHGTTPSVVDVSDAPAPADGSGLRIGGYVTAGVGVAALAGALATGLASRATSDRYANAVVTNASEAHQAGSTFAQAHRQAVAADVLYGVGGAFVVAGAIMLLLSRRGSDPDALAFTPVAGPGYALLRVRGSFGSAP